jgi:menaquinone-dependent protoporphyrinogen IX oxidase
VVHEFVAKNRRELMAAPATGFFSTCLTATPGTREAYLESLGPVRRFLDDVSWTLDWIASFPGALNYRECNPNHETNLAQRRRSDRHEQRLRTYALGGSNAICAGL